ncbi:MAG TPA: hypothetical protein VMJ30_03335 [Gemmatimonadales bacterium]|nr:hypothetical protein [Gemmatimonadales bacterium]
MSDASFIGVADFSSGFNVFRLLSIGFPVVVLLILWLLVAGTLTLREPAVEKPNRVAQLYGYTVCLIALILGLMSVSGLMDAAFERANPLQGGDYPFGASLTSFDAFKARHGDADPFERRENAAPDTASEATLRIRFDALVAERLARVQYQTSRELVTKTILLLLSLGLFAFHWRWVRRLSIDEAPMTD